VLTNILQRIFGTSTEREIKKLLPLVQEVRAHEQDCVRMSNDELRGRTQEFRRRIAPSVREILSDESLDELDALEANREIRARLDPVLAEVLPEAYAVVCEAAKRVTGMRPFDVQVIGGIVLHRGNIAEMVTGEGKTLVATMPVYLNALAGLGVHVVTVNDYLARRDREWMGPIYEFLGLTVGLIQHDMVTPERQVGYRADITYGTNNEFGFDYLRDNMALRPEMRVQRGLHYAIVDEIDSILIDEARTPLIISGRPRKSTDLYYKVDEAVRRLKKEEHFEAEEKGHNVMLTEDGMTAVERALGVEDLYTDEHIGTVHMVEQSLKAHNFFKRDDEYVVRDGQVHIVDEFTGRVLEGRRYSDGLHQAIEAKERVTIQFETQTMASVSYQNLFKLYTKLAGMTGTAYTEAREFATIYDLDVMRIPTNLPLVREDNSDLVFATEPGKFKQVVEEIVRIHETGRPVLVGTVSIEKSELVAQMLDERGVKGFEVLNAKNHGREAVIVANAGKRGAITIATNMAGRGTDIKLGEGVRELGGLAIVGTERHDSRRIDNQLRGRCGRQGDPGTTQFYLSLEDEVARLFGGDRVKRVLDMVGGQAMDDEPLSQKMVSRSIERAQRQVEEYNFEIRKHLKQYDDVMDRQRRVIYDIRAEVLEDRDISARLRDMIENTVADAVEQYAPEDALPDNWDLEGLDARLSYMFNAELDVTGAREEPPRPMREDLVEQIAREYERREKDLAERIRKDFVEAHEGRKPGSGEAAAEQVDFAKVARRRLHNLEKMILLRTVDDKWIDHLYTMDYLKESVRLRAYGQRDPLLEYKKEGFETFQAMMASIEETVLQALFRITDPEHQRMREQSAETREERVAADDPLAGLSDYSFVAANKQQDRSFAAYDTSRFALAGQQGEGRPAAAEGGGNVAVEDEPPRKKPTPVKHHGPKVKPNDPCPCGSGKKYKKCCGGVQ
jgi:preprotein translocase subunit SecA